MRSKKTPSQSKIETRQIVMPEHTNPQNTIFGGVIMSWIDIAAAMCAMKHAGHPVVTAQIDNIVFRAPVKVGEFVLISAIPTFSGQSSLEIETIVTSENPYDGTSKVTTTARLTFVALKKDGGKFIIPELCPESDSEQKAWQEAQQRMLIRKKERPS